MFLRPLVVAAILMLHAGASASSTTCASDDAPRVRRTRDGRSFVFDCETNSWRLKESAPEEVQAEASLALPWSQFNVSFDGSFQIAGRPILLGSDPDRRPQTTQEHADTGTSIWDGAVALSKFLEKQPELVRGRKVLELGAGRGLAGLAAAALGAEAVYLTDLAYCLEALETAAQLTAAAAPDPGVVVAELDWCRAADFFAARPGMQLDVVLAADVVWLIDLVEPLAEAMAAVALRFPTVDFLVVHQTRSSNVERAFLEALERRSLRLAWSLPGESPPGFAWHEDFTPDSRIKLWCFKLQAEPATAQEKLP